MPFRFSPCNPCCGDSCLKPTTTVCPTYSPRWNVTLAGFVAAGCQIPTTINGDYELVLVGSDPSSEIVIWRYQSSPIYAPVFPRVSLELNLDDSSGLYLRVIEDLLTCSSLANYTLSSGISCFGTNILSHSTGPAAFSSFPATITLTPNSAPITVCPVGCFCSAVVGTYEFDFGIDHFHLEGSSSEGICSWTSSALPSSSIADLQSGFSGNIGVFALYIATFTGFAIYVLRSDLWNCLGNNTLNLYQTSIPGAPATITLTAI